MGYPETKPGRNRYNFTVVDRDTDWPVHADPKLDLPACTIDYRAARTGLLAFLLTPAGNESLAQTFDAAGTPLSDGDMINISGGGFDNFNGSFFLDHAGRRLVVDIPYDHGPRAQIVREGNGLLARIHDLAPGSVSRSYGLWHIQAGKKLVPIGVREESPDSRDIIWSGGLIMNPYLPLQIPVVMRMATADGESADTLSISESRQLQAQMIGICTEIFIKSGEKILILPQVNSSDFVFTNSGLRLVTARGNLFDRDNYLYSRLPGIDRVGPGSTFGIKKVIDWKRFPDWLIAQHYNVEASLRALDELSGLPDRWTPRQKLVISYLLVQETFDHRTVQTVQFWPAQAIFAGITAALKANGFDTRAARNWWSQGPDSPLEAIGEFRRLLNQRIFWTLLPQVSGIPFDHVHFAKVADDLDQAIRNRYSLPKREQMN